MGYVLGIDVSTTATKAVLIDESGAVVGIGTAEYGFESPQPLWSEQDPRLWWDGSIAAIRSVLASTGVAAADIAAVGLTGQMHGAVLLDAAGEVLRPAILWNDQRTAAECDAIREAVGAAAAHRDHRERRADRVHRAEARLGARPRAGGLGPDRPRAAAEGLRAASAHRGVRARQGRRRRHDPVRPRRARLVGGGRRGAGDRPGAGCRRRSRVPAVTGAVTAEAAAATGLREGTPVVAGAGDQAANAVGVGAVTPGVVALSLGTSGRHLRHDRVTAARSARPGPRLLSRACPIGGT